MRKSLWIMLAVLLVAIGAPAVHADGVFAITFSGVGAPTVVGSNLLDYNSTTMEFTTPSFEIMYDGLKITLDNLSFSGVDPTATFFWAGPDIQTPGQFIITYQHFVPEQNIYSGPIPVTAAFHDGTATFTAVTAPEPSSVALMLVGVGLVFVMRKRIGQRLPQAS